MDISRQVNENDIKTMHEATGLEIIEASAKMSIKINEIMEILTKKLIERKNKESADGQKTKGGMSLDNKTTDDGKKGCC